MITENVVDYSKALALIVVEILPIFLREIATDSRK
jgi:hypothetical protein